jgi:NADH-quinone oxidoreductase subunit N
MPGIKADMWLLGPEIALVAAMVLIVLVSARRSAPGWRIAQRIALLGALAATALVFLTAGAHGLVFNGMLAVDPLSSFFKVFFLVAGVLVILFSARSREIAGPNEGEYYVLIMASLTGMFLLTAAADLLTLYISLELVSLTSYALAGFNRTDRRSSEAALKYVILGVITSGVMIYGVSLIYGLTGGTGYADVARGLADFNAAAFGLSRFFLVIMVLLMVFAGFAFKIAAVPFHMWCPDVYEGAPTPVAAFLSVVPKAAGFGAMIRFFYTVLSQNAGDGRWTLYLDINWPALIAVIAIATMTVGNLSAIRQTNLKRLLAFSSIGQGGFILMGTVVLTAQGLAAVLVYLSVFLFMNLGAFIAVMVVREITGGESIENCRGLGWRSPFLGVMLTIFMFSLVGVPPLAGFVGKLYIFMGLMGEHWYVLAAAGAVNTVIALYYYMRVVKALYLERPGDGADNDPMPIGAYFAVLLVACAIPTVLLGLAFGPLVRFAGVSVSMILP